VAEAEDDGVNFHERMAEIHTELQSLNAEANTLMAEILKNWEELS
jgi:type I restriction enzyme M protein